MTCRAPEAGLTLVEILVSLSIFSVIGLASLGLIQSLARTDTQLAIRTDGIAEADRALAILETSLLNAEPESIKIDPIALTVSAGPALRYFFEGNAFRREISDGRGAMTQTLSKAMPAGSWQISPDGRLLVFEFTLHPGLEGSRVFPLPR